jgi:predicted secreted protein
VHAGFRAMQYKYNQAGAGHACHALSAPQVSVLNDAVSAGKKTTSSQVDLFL